MKHLLPKIIIKVLKHFILVLKKIFFGRRRVLSRVVALLLIIPVIVFGFSYFSRGAEAAWFNDEWAYRKAIDVTNSGSQQGDVYINLTGADDLDTSDTTRFQSDCGDIRFTKQNGELLSYYIVSGCGTADTVIHVNFDVFPVGDQIIYVYYGNPSAPNGFSPTDFRAEASSYSIGSQATEEKAPAPIAHWKFDEAAGTVASDSASFKLHGDLFGPAWQEDDLCLSGTCLFFDGSNDNINIRDKTQIEFSNGTDFTLSLWVRTPMTSHATLIAKKAATTVGNSGYMLNLLSTGDIVFYASDGSDQYQLSTAIGTVSSNTWTHIVVVYDNDSTADTAIYVNGVKKNTTPNGTLSNVDDVGVNSRELKIGSEADDQLYYQGFMDDVKIYPYALSAAQIKANYASRGSSLAGAVLGTIDDSLLSDGLVGYWKMDETAANSCTGGVNDSCDSSGNGLDGAWNGNAAASMSAKFGAGTTHDGTGDYVSVADNANLDFGTGQDFSYSMWVKRRTQTDSAFLISKGAAGIADTGYSLVMSDVPGGQQPILELSKPGESARLEIAGAGITDSNWHHIVAVHDRDGMGYLYIDGRLDASADISSYNVDLSNSQNLAFAATSDGSTAFDGVLDDFRMYNRVLSPLEVERLYEWAPGPMGHWDFEERQGATAKDRSGNGYNGTLRNGPQWSKGKVGSSVGFDGSDDDVQVSSGFGSLTTMTYSAWIYPRSGGESDLGRILHKKNNSTGTPSILIENRGGSFATRALQFEHGFSGGNAFWTSPNNALVFNQWNHVAVTYDNSNADFDPIMYINGQRVTSFSEDSNSTGTATADDSVFFIGNRSDGARTFDGYIDEVKVYNYIRSHKQIIQDLNSGHPAVGSPVGSAIGHWKFDAGYGNVASNSGSLGSAAHGQMLNFVSPPSAISGWTQDGKFGKALNFDGADDIVEVNNSIAFDNMSSFSLSMWINRRSSGENSLGRILEKTTSTASANGWQFYNSGSGLLAFDADFSGSGLTRVSSLALSLNTWHHVVLTWDGSSTASNIHMYVDGKEVTYTSTINGTGSRDSDAGVPIRIGSNIARTRSFDGWIDEVKIYNYVLSSSEVRLDMNQGKSLVLGSFGTSADGKTGSHSASARYCVPGDTTTASCQPVAEWNFEEGYGNTTQDTGGNNRHGVFSGAVSWANGKVGKAANVDGSTGTVRIEDHSLLDITGALSISAWVKGDSFGTGADEDRIVMKGPGGHSSNLYTFELANGRPRFFIHDADPPADPTTQCTGLDATDQDCVLGATTLQTGRWYHITGTYDGATSLKIYVNGVLDGSVTLQSASTGTALTDSVRIGGRPDDSDMFDGAIDQVKIYNYGLSAAQVAWEYNRGKPIAHYKFDECQGSTLNDSSGNGLHGTISAGVGGETTIGTCSTASTMWGSGAVGKYNGAIEFDVTDDNINVGSQTLLDDLPTKSGMTISVWINPDTQGEGSAGRIVDKRTSSSTGWQLNMFETAGQHAVGFTADYDGGTDKALETVFGLFTYGTWFHVVFSWDGTASGGTWYINGNQVPTSDNDAGTGSYVSDASVDMYIGNRGALDRTFDGQIDELQIFNYPVTAYQAKLLYNQSAGVRFGPVTGTP